MMFVNQDLFPQELDNWKGWGYGNKKGVRVDVA